MHLFKKILFQIQILFKGIILGNSSKILMNIEFDSFFIMIKFSFFEININFFN